MFAELLGVRLRAQYGERRDSVDDGHKIELEAVAVTRQTNHTGTRINRAEHNGIEGLCHGFQLLGIARRLADEEVEVDGGDGRALKGCRGVSNEDRLKPSFGEHARDGLQDGARVLKLSF